MIIPDINLLVHAVQQRSLHHEQAAAWLGRSLVGAEQVGFAWLALVGFVRVATAAFHDHPLSVDEAFEAVEAWLAAPAARVLHPTDDHARLLRSLLEPVGTAGNLTNDAHLAALSIEHQGVVFSADSDFDRFPGVQWENPLAA